MSYTITGEKKIAHLLDFLEKQPRDAKIIDIGGTKHDQQVFLSHGFTDVTISNNSKVELEECKPHGLVLDIVKEPKKNLHEKYDIIVCMDVIEHLVNPDYALANMNTMLKPNGYLILSTPNLSNLFNRFFLLAGWSLPNYHTAFVKTGNPFLKARISTNFRNSYAHKSVFTHGQLLEWVSAYGFDIVTTKGYDYGSKKDQYGGGNFSGMRDVVDRILPSSLKEGIFLVAQKKKKVGVDDVVKRYSTTQKQDVE